MDKNRHPHQVVVGVTDEAQRDALRRGLDGAAIRYYQLPADQVKLVLTPPLDDFVEVDERGRVTLAWAVTWYAGYGSSQEPRWALTSGEGQLTRSPTDALDAIRAIEEAIQLRAAKRAEGVRERLKRFLAGEDVRDPQELPKDPDLDEVQRVLAQDELDRRARKEADRQALAVQEVRQWIARGVSDGEPAWDVVSLSELRDEVRAHRTQLSVQAEARRAEERLAWVEAHGSETLRRLVTLGLPWREVYDEEQADALDARLKAERPGWSWDDDDDLRLCDLTDPRHVEPENLDALEEARKVDPKAELCWLVENEDMPVSRGDRVVLRASFGGRTIWREATVDEPQDEAEPEE